MNICMPLEIWSNGSSVASNNSVAWLPATTSSPNDSHHSLRSPPLSSGPADCQQALGRVVAFTLADGASNSIRFPASGPYDLRLGYALEPSFEERLTARGFAVSSQARDSARMLALADDGLFLPYDEKDQAGLLP